jgi:hypothetical protein
MAEFDRLEEPEDPKQLRSAAVEALKDAARQSDPREFSRLTRHALNLIERARAIGHGREHPVSEAQVFQRDDAVGRELSHKIIKFIVRLWRRSA